MKLGGTGQRQQTRADPFGTLLAKPYKQTVGAGIGVNRLETGIASGEASIGLPSMEKQSPYSAATKEAAPGKNKDRDFANQALGETPPRDGPFTFGAAGVAENYPTGAIQKKSSKDRTRRARPNPLAFANASR
jgi:hypothetical protein